MKKLMSLFRLLLLFLLGWIVWRLLRPSPPQKTKFKPTEKKEALETIAACAWCGMYVPENEMLVSAKQDKYCCAEHLSLADSQKEHEREKRR